MSSAAIFGMFATQSNDFALGYPLVDALYSRSHPHYLAYIYLFAPISLLFLNPIAFFMLEADAQSERAATVKWPRLVGRATLGAIFGNLTVLMTLLGCVSNFLLDRRLPALIDGPLEVLGSAFAAACLFSLGLKMDSQVKALFGEC